MSRPLSKTVRFEVFKRDLFVCQYCGQRPPAVILEVDHVIPISEGGSDDIHNLLTACFDCNRGKGARQLDVSPIDVAARRAALEERREQVRAYEMLLAEERASQDEIIDQVIEVYENAFKGWTLLDGARPSIRRFLTLLPPTEVLEAMEVACARVNKDRAFRYFCGVCWRKAGSE